MGLNTLPLLAALAAGEVNAEEPAATTTTDIAKHCSGPQDSRSARVRRAEALPGALAAIESPTKSEMRADAKMRKEASRLEKAQGMLDRVAKHLSRADLDVMIVEEGNLNDATFEDAMGIEAGRIPVAELKAKILAAKEILATLTNEDGTPITVEGDDPQADIDEEIQHQTYLMVLDVLNDPAVIGEGFSCSDPESLAWFIASQDGDKLSFPRHDQKVPGYNPPAATTLVDTTGDSFTQLEEIYRLSALKAVSENACVVADQTALNIASLVSADAYPELGSLALTSTVESLQEEAEAQREAREALQEEASSGGTISECQQIRDEEIADVEILLDDLIETFTKATRGFVQANEKVILPEELR